MLPAAVLVGPSALSAVEIITRRRQGAENVFIAAAEDLVRRTASLNHRDVVFLGNRRVGENEIAGERAEKKINFVLGDELHVLTHA